MHKMPKVKSVMSAFPYTVDFDDLVTRAADLMQEHGIRHLPVIADGAIYGIVSEADLRVAMTLRPEPESDLYVGLVCTKDPYTVDIEEPLDTVALEMAQRQVGSAVVRKGSKLAGIVTTTDICRLLAELLRERSPTAPGDDVA